MRITRFAPLNGNNCKLQLYFAKILAIQVNSKSWLDVWAWLPVIQLNHEVKERQTQRNHPEKPLTVKKTRRRKKEKVCVDLSTLVKGI